MFNTVGDGKPPVIPSLQGKSMGEWKSLKVLNHPNN